MKKGFTLIELLAVIVILAIIALIATPIVLNIINDSKESSVLRSADFYLDGVEFAVAQSTLESKNIKDGTYNILESGNICLETYDETAKTCSDNDNITDNNELVVEVDGEVPSSGTITIESGKIADIELIYSNGKTIVKNDGKLVYQVEEDISSRDEKTLATICTHDGANGIAEKTAGAKYSCEVKKGTIYNFYVLTTPSDGEETINLIMDQNINSDGTEAGMIGTTKSTNASQYNLVEWISDSTYGCDGVYCATNVKGPITAMQFLYNATKDWTNIDPVNYAYNDKTIQGSTAENGGYSSFVSTNGAATITSLSGDAITIGSEATPLRARMPIYASDASITEVANKTDANAYLYDNLDPNGGNVPYGYWTLSSYSTDIFSVHAWRVSFDGIVDSCSIYDDDGADYGVFKDFGAGVRPVINLKI